MPEEIAKGEIKFSTKIFYGNANYLDKVVRMCGVVCDAAMH